MTNVHPLFGQPASARGPANINLPHHFHMLRGHLYTIAEQCLSLSQSPSFAPETWGVLSASLGAVGVGLRCAIGMARTAEDAVMQAALGRAATALVVIQPDGDPQTTRDLLARAGRAMLAAVAEADPNLWAKAEPIFAGAEDGQGGAA
jgi:hypothetical protein